jgi:preprotein translocase subunit SecG
MGYLIGLLTFVMVMICLIVIFLVLIQLPKKEAGAGLAFGASATDALFGAGSGNVLTKITKYGATAFFVMAVVLSVLYNIQRNRSGSSFSGNLGKGPAGASAPLAVPPPIMPSNSTAPALSNATPATNLPAESTTVPKFNVPTNGAVAPAKNP